MRSVGAPLLTTLCLEKTIGTCQVLNPIVMEVNLTVLDLDLGMMEVVAPDSTPAQAF
jgi:hypothetical protein